VINKILKKIIQSKDVRSDKILIDESNYFPYENLVLTILHTI